MKTTPCPNLPRPPDIMRAQCPEAKPINYLSDYLWKFNNALFRNFSWMYRDLRYGALQFDDDRTLDCGEMKYDSSNFTMNICGTDYTSATTTTTSYNAEEIDPRQVQEYGVSCDPDADIDEGWDDYTNDPTYRTYKWFGVGKHIIGRYYTYTYPPGCGGLGYFMRGDKAYVTFDTSGAAANPSSALIRFYLWVVDFDDPVEPTIKLYSQDWGDAVDTGDWTSTESLESTQVVSESDVESYIDMAVSTDSLNIGGDSKYKFSLQCIEDRSIPTDSNKSGSYLWFKTITLRISYLGWQ